MKKIALLTALAIVGLLSANSAQASFTSTNALSVQVKLIALVNLPQTSKTNGTKVTESVKVTKVKITNQDILNLLTTEFGPSFDGDQLAYRIESSPGQPAGFVVTDSSGNPIQYVSTNLVDSSYFFDLTNFVDQSYIENGSAVLNTETTNSTTSATVYQSDQSLRYADENGNDFHVTGMVVGKEKLVQMPDGSTIPSASINIKPAQGGGTFSSYDEAVITGSIALKGKNIIGD